VVEKGEVFAQHPHQPYSHRGSADEPMRKRKPLLAGYRSASRSAAPWKRADLALKIYFKSGKVKMASAWPAARSRTTSARRSRSARRIETRAAVKERQR
jgi:tmRNA-binding protein